MKKTAGIAMVLVMVLFLAACGEGYFRATYAMDNGETFDFYKDGTVEIYKDSMGFGGTYERTAKDTYDIRIDALFVQVHFIAVRGKDSITVTEKDNPGTEDVYQLVK